MHLQKVINQLAYRHQISNVFDDFMQLAICCFAMKRMEEEYLAIIKRYKPEEQKLFGLALGAMVLDYESNSCQSGSWKDVLGNLFEETNSASQASYNGQFFTPQSICQLMAEMTEEKEQKQGLITVNDPSCGSGRNLIAHARLKPNNRFSTFYVGSDLDYRCVKMSVLNFLMFGMAGVVIHMNTLSMEIYRGFRCWMPETGLGISPLSIEQCKQYL
jgi:type I restriction enzyme M protein